MGSLTLRVMKGMRDLHWVFLGLSVAAFAVESYMRIGSTENECRELLLKILQLSQDIKEYSKLMPDKKERVWDGIIVEGAVICHDYLNRGKFSRFWSAATVAAQLDKTNNQLKDVRDSLVLSAELQILRQTTRRLDQSPLRLLEFQPVGIEDQVGKVKALLDMEGAQSALAVIVCGFGGFGKSTLALSVVESLNWSSRDFFCRVVIDESKCDKKSHIIDLQKQIIYKLEGVKFDFHEPDEGRKKIKEAVKNKCFLLFIDIVVDKDYVGELLPRDWSSKDENTKLRILITSRQKNVKEELKIDCKFYYLEALSHGASKCLLFETIMEDKVVENKDFDEKGMIKKVAAACNGVPLLLLVFGKHLRAARDEDNYLEALNEALKVLTEGNQEDLNTYREGLCTRLMFVYNKIPKVEVKEAFLDICSYFNGWEWDLVADIVDLSTLTYLSSRMLVSNVSGQVIVHDILRLMVTEEARHSRFSNYKELSDTLKDNLDGSSKVKGVSLVNDNSLITIQSTQLEGMNNSLRVLILGDWVTMDGPPCHNAFTNLRYLQLGDITFFPFKDPSKLNNLKVFLNRSMRGINLYHLQSSVRRISREVPPHVECVKFAKLPFHNLSSLKSFIFKTPKSVELPEELHLPASLVYLHLNKCNNLPKDIGHLTALQSLMLDGSDMKCLPQGFGKLQKLKNLSMDYCSKLTFLSDELGMLSSLEALSMKGCVNLRSLPERLEGLVALQRLELTGSISLHVLPKSFGELPVTSLELESMVKLNELPNSFGNMPLLENLSIISCDSLMSLPNSFVQLKMLQSLTLDRCIKLSALPKDFGRLRYLKEMTVWSCPLFKELPHGFGGLRYLKKMSVSSCHLFKELPHGFGALPALKVLNLSYCDSFVNLPTDFTELTSLETLTLDHLPLISRFPDGFGKLKNLGDLYVEGCFQLKTLCDDFENMATLGVVRIVECPELDGAMMEKILKLQHCYRAHINDSSELIKKWKQMQSEIEHPVVVYDGGNWCMEVNNATDQLMERSSLFAVLEKGTSVTVALIMLPIHVGPDEDQTCIQQFVDMASEKAKTNGSDTLQIVCARKSDRWAAERAIPPEEEDRVEEEAIRRILLLLPKGSCAIPSSESKRLNVLSSCFNLGNDASLVFFMANEGLDIDYGTILDIDYGTILENSKFTEVEHDNAILNFIRSIHPYSYRRAEGHSQSESVAGESKTREFMEVLKGNGIDYLITDNNTSKVKIGDLLAKAIGFIICNFQLLEYTKMRQIYKDLQQMDSNFIAIWIPTEWPKDCGHDTYTRLIQVMPWATFPHDTFTKFVQCMPSTRFPFGNGDFFLDTDPCFVLLDKHGQIANHDALPLLLAWGVTCYPFSQRTITESLSFTESESCLEFLLHGMNIVGRKPMKKKVTFLYAVLPSDPHMNELIDQLTQINGNFEVLYVGRFYSYEWKRAAGPKLKREYEERLREYDGRWASLSYSDMLMFWARCEYLASEEGYELNKEPLHWLAKCFFHNFEPLQLVDNDGLVTCGGVDVLQMMFDSSDEISNGEEMRMVKDELMESLSRGECSPIVKTFFRDEIDNHPHHPHHPISYKTFVIDYRCGVCSKSKSKYDGGRRYTCNVCRWHMCGSCWMEYAKQQVQHLMLARDN